MIAMEGPAAQQQGGEQLKGAGVVSKKRWAEMCALLRAQHVDNETTDKTIEGLKQIYKFDPETYTSSATQRARVRRLREKHKEIISRAAGCAQCSSATGCDACVTAAHPASTSAE